MSGSARTSANQTAAFVLVNKWNSTNKISLLLDTFWLIDCHLSHLACIESLVNTYKLSFWTF